MKKLKAILVLLLLFAQVNVLAFAQESQTEAQGVKTLEAVVHKGFTSRKYILGPNDIISIKSATIPELDQANVRIQPDGKVFLSPIGEVEAAGMSMDELHDTLQSKYSYYLKNPQIALGLVQTRPFIVYVSGSVLNPGSYELNTNTDNTNYVSNVKPEIQIERKTPLLSNVLVAAGGITYDADLEHIQIKNSLDGSTYEVNLIDLLDNANSNQDMYLMTGDTVYVPKLSTPLALSDVKYKKYASATFSPRKVPVKVFGYVNTPGLISLDPAQSLNINSAITSAGGYFNDSAYAPKFVYLSRLDENGHLVTRKINPMQNDVLVMPNDIVYVPEKTRPLAGKACDYLTRMFVPVNTFANTYNNWGLMFNPHRYLLYR